MAKVSLVLIWYNVNVFRQQQRAMNRMMDSFFGGSGGFGFGNSLLGPPGGQMMPFGGGFPGLGGIGVGGWV